MTMTAVAPAQTAGAGPFDTKWARWTGWVLSALPPLAMALSAFMKLAHPPPFLEQWVGKFGWPEGAATAIGLVELACAVLYVIPRTAVLGAVLVTGYLGGAVATHARIGEPAFIMPAVLGVLAWGGLFLRDERIRALLPVRRPPKR